MGHKPDHIMQGGSHIEGCPGCLAEMIQKVARMGDQKLLKELSEARTNDERSTDTNWKLWLSTLKRFAVERGLEVPGPKKGYVAEIRVFIVDSEMQSETHAIDYLAETLRGLPGIRDWSYLTTKQGRKTLYHYPTEVSFDETEYEEGDLNRLSVRAREE